ncbi:hypothetical protein EII11_03560 [Schaalia canis]|uniref:Pilus assembly protein TadE n=1 Tax=Schaalia canis TaxID=100469 RepID=A0A3P1SG34_9ACTO|nr:hypothetical protein EII11_03560 [Schaalia canis]
MVGADVMRVRSRCGLPQSRCHAESGSVSVEFALGLVAVMSVLAMILAGLDAGQAKAQACQLAREGARHAAREAAGGSDTLNPLPLPLALPSGYEAGSLSLAVEGQWVRARAQWPVRSAVVWLAPHMTCEVVTLREEVGM